jgi:hypothetical protein
MLSDENKKRLEDFLLKKSEVYPASYIPSEDEDEAVEYARLFTIKELSRMLAKVCGEI